MKIIYLFIFFITISCSNNKVVKTHGVNALEKKINKIEVSKTNKNDILNSIGRPSTISLFDKNLWFYIEREKTNQSVFKLGKSKIKKNNVLEVSFDEFGIVKTAKIYKIDNMNDLQVNKEVTLKSYDNQSYMRKLIKSLEQKINSPIKDRR